MSCVPGGEVPDLKQMVSRELPGQSRDWPHSPQKDKLCNKGNLFGVAKSVGLSLSFSLVGDFVNIPSYGVFCGLKCGSVEGGPAWPGQCGAPHARPAGAVDAQTFDQKGVVVAPRREGALAMLVSSASPASPASPTQTPLLAVLAYP